MVKKTRSVAAAGAKVAEKPTKGKGHLRFDEVDDLADAEPSSEEDEVMEDQGEGSSSGSDEEDEAPEAISAVTGRRRAKEQEQAMREFELAALQARRQANKSKDAKRKASKPTAPLPPIVDDDDASASDDVEEADEPAPPQSGQRRYLDPSIFASASDQLDQAKKEAEAVAAAQRVLRRKDKKKRKRAQAVASSQEVDGVVYRHVGEAATRTAQPRHAQADKFVRSRLFNTSEYRRSLPKATVLSKEAMGKRRPTASLSNLARKRGKPASSFVRAT